MEWQASLVALSLQKHAEDSSIAQSVAHVFLSALLAGVILFSAGAAVVAMKVDAEPRQAISSAIPGPVASSCKHVRWCSKPVRPNYIGGYPLSLVEENAV